MKKELYGVYAQSWDMTFIMEDTYNDEGELIFTECVGWYHGEPDERDNEFFKGKLKASYEWSI